MKPWKMIFKDINNDDELDKFIKKVFWDTCRLESLPVKKAFLTC